MIELLLLVALRMQKSIRAWPSKYQSI